MIGTDNDNGDVAQMSNVVYGMPQSRDKKKHIRIDISSASKYDTHYDCKTK